MDNIAHLPLVVDSLERAGMTLLAPASATGGQFELIEDVRAVGAGTVPHVHTAHDEAFLVLEGRFRFDRGESRLDADPGTFLFVPRNTRHRYAALTDGARLLFIVTPPGLSGFLRAQGALLREGMPLAATMELLATHFDSHTVP